MFSLSTETYREYKEVKSCLSGEGVKEKKVKRVHFEQQEHQQSPPTGIRKDGVFGLSLNNKPKTKMNGDTHTGKGEGERKSIWKLHRWSKNRGHHTVVVNGEEEKDCEQGSEETDKETPESTTEESKKVSKGVNKTYKQCTLVVCIVHESSTL